jgi:hypothetical protein
MRRAQTFGTLRTHAAPLTLDHRHATPLTPPATPLTPPGRCVRPAALLSRVVASAMPPSSHASTRPPCRPTLTRRCVRHAALLSRITASALPPCSHACEPMPCAQGAALDAFLRPPLEPSTLAAACGQRARRGLPPQSAHFCHRSRSRAARAEGSRAAERDAVRRGGARVRHGRCGCARRRTDAGRWRAAFRHVSRAAATAHSTDLCWHACGAAADSARRDGGVVWWCGRCDAQMGARACDRGAWHVAC